MNKILTFIIFLLMIIILGYYFLSSKMPTGDVVTITEDETTVVENNVPSDITEDTLEQMPNDDVEENAVGIANPASTHCNENGGKLEIIKDTDGGELGLCVLSENQRCEEWAYFRGECDFEGDAALIRQALIDKGLDLSNSNVVINTHMGKYIAGGVRPNSDVGGGGYVFAEKDNGQINIVADGNGIISCASLTNYSDFPGFLIPECYDEATSTMVKR